MIILNPYAFGPSAPPAPTYRYWRIYITATNGDVYTTLHEAEYRATPGGADQSTPTSGFACSSSHPALGPGSLIDNNWSSSWGTDGSATASVGNPHWHRVDLGSPKTVAEIDLRPPSAAFINRAPRDFQIQGSNDDITWTTTRSYTGVPWVGDTHQQFSTT